jgi:uncharacterized phage-associated protein
MTINVYRNKLLNAVLFFAKNTHHCNKTKLLKLIYHLDFIHFRQTGFPSIGLTYYTYKEGPVPVRFWKEVQNGKVPQDFQGKFDIQITYNPKINKDEFIFTALAEPDLSYFSPRESRILEALAKTYKDKTAKQISEGTHLPNQPWDTTLKTKGKNKPIDYMLSLDTSSSVSWETATNNLSEFYAVVKNLKLNPTKATESI